MWRSLIVACSLTTGAVLGLQPSTVPVVVAWDLASDHAGATWELEADGFVQPCTNVQVLASERRCTVQLSLGTHTIRLRGIHSGASGPLIGAWSLPVTGTVEQTVPGSFTITAKFVQSPPDMASPSLTGTTASSTDTSSGTTRTHDLPASIQAGETLICLFATSEASVTTDWSGTGFTEFATAQAGTSGARVRLSAAWKKATGSEGSTIALSVSSSVDRSVAHSFRVSGAADPSVSAPEADVSFVSQASSNSIDPAELAPTGGSKDYLWLAVAAWRANTSVSSDPANYDSPDVIQIAGLSSAAGIAFSGRQLTASSEDPGAFTLGANSSRRVGFTVAIYPAAATTAEPGAGALTFAGLAASLGFAILMPDEL